MLLNITVYVIIITVITRQLQVERRTAKDRRSNKDRRSTTVPRNNVGKVSYAGPIVYKVQLEETEWQNTANNEGRKISTVIASFQYNQM